MAIQYRGRDLSKKLPTTHWDFNNAIYININEIEWVKHRGHCEGVDIMVK